MFRKQPTGEAYIELSSFRDVNSAMRRHRDRIGTRWVFFNYVGLKKVFFQIEVLQKSCYKLKTKGPTSSFKTELFNIFWLST